MIVCLALPNPPYDSQRSHIASLFIDEKTEALRDYITELVVMRWNWSSCPCYTFFSYFSMVITAAVIACSSSAEMNVWRCNFWIWAIWEKSCWLKSVCEVCQMIVLGFVMEASFCFSPRSPDFKGDFWFCVKGNLSSGRVNITLILL